MVYLPPSLSLGWVGGILYSKYESDVCGVHGFFFRSGVVWIEWIWIRE